MASNDYESGTARRMQPNQKSSSLMNRHHSVASYDSRNDSSGAYSFRANRYKQTMSSEKPPRHTPAPGVSLDNSYAEGHNASG